MGGGKPCMFSFEMFLICVFILLTIYLGGSNLKMSNLWEDLVGCPA